MQMRRFSWNLIVATLALAMSACGSSQMIPVKGKLTKGGGKYEVPTDQKLHLTFRLMESANDGGGSTAAGQAFMAIYKTDDGTFSVGGIDGNGIPPGKYRVSLTQLLTRDAVDKKNANIKGKQKLFERDTDLLDGQYGEKSPIVVEIKDSTELAIELDKYKDELARQAAEAAAAARKAALSGGD
jgi:hypothetical protein